MVTILINHKIRDWLVECQDFSCLFPVHPEKIPILIFEAKWANAQT
jgi:hypothetical protein